MDPTRKPDKRSLLALRLGKKQPCANCKKGFVPHTKRQIYCTDRCRYRHRDDRPERREYDRRRHREDHAAGGPLYDRPSKPKARAEYYGVAYEPVSPETIFARDDWTCGICGKAVDQKLAYPDPMCASIDHVIPWTAGGEHLASNLQCSHLVCNLRKSSKLPEELIAKD